MIRITETQLARNMINYITQNRKSIAEIGDQISNGVTVNNPGDSKDAGIISQFQSSLSKSNSYANRISVVKGSVDFQMNVMNQSGDLMIRAKEIATQAANETNSTLNRATLAEEIFQLRDELVSLANSQYQGKYIYGGSADDTPPYSAATYTTPATGAEHDRYVFTTDLGASVMHTVSITDNLTIQTGSSGDIFKNSIQSLERLGRALKGYDTLPASPADPDGTGNAYTFPADFATQTQAINASIDLIETARNTDLLSEQTTLAGRLNRIEAATSLLELTKTSSQEALDQYTGTDMYAAATELSTAQTALQASLAINSKILNMSILDYL